MNPTADEIAKPLKELILEIDNKISELETSGSYKKIKECLGDYPNDSIIGKLKLIRFMCCKEIYLIQNPIKIFVPHQGDKPEPKREWEILSLELDGRILEINAYGYYLHLKSKDDTVKIHSVKRSDGAVFTVRDMVEFEHNGKTIKDAIVYFSIIETDMVICFSVAPKHPMASININNVIKIEKTPLFVTEDGKEVFEGDKVHFVNEIFSVISVSASDLKYEENSEKGVVERCFSTLSAAQDYILMNKPLFSLKDLDRKFPPNTPREAIECVVNMNKILWKIAKDRLNYK